MNIILRILGTRYIRIGDYCLSRYWSEIDAQGNWRDCIGLLIERAHAADIVVIRRWGNLC